MNRRERLNYLLALLGYASGLLIAHSKSFWDWQFISAMFLALVVGWLSVDRAKSLVTKL